MSEKSPGQSNTRLGLTKSNRRDFATQAYLVRGIFVVFVVFISATALRVQKIETYLAQGLASRTLEVAVPSDAIDRRFIIMRGFCWRRPTPATKPACTKRAFSASHRKYLPHTTFVVFTTLKIVAGLPWREGHARCRRATNQAKPLLHGVELLG